MTLVFVLVLCGFALFIYDGVRKLRHRRECSEAMKEYMEAMDALVTCEHCWCKECKHKRVCCWCEIEERDWDEGPE